MPYAIITENDSSAWSDKTGEMYHFPSMYLKLIPFGTQVIYYKGRLKSVDKEKFGATRLTTKPHYFGLAEIGKITRDTNSKKNDFFAEIKNYTPFTKPVLAKNNTGYFEIIPDSRKTNYWRDGVRASTKKINNSIIKASPISKNGQGNNDLNQGLELAFESQEEGGSKKVISTRYERDPLLRQQAVIIHGYSCMACTFNFGRVYGEWGNGFIHVHHNKPLASSGKVKINPKDDLIVLCANCHSMVHRKRDRTLTLYELKQIIRRNAK